MNDAHSGLPFDTVPCVTACTSIGQQQVCLTADVTITPCVVCQPPIVVCLGPAQIVKPSENPCPGGTLSTDGTCRFTISQTLSVKVPISFGANAECQVGQVFCFAATTPPDGDPSDPPLPDRFLFTRSADFYQQNLFPANFTDAELCVAVQSVGANSAFLHALLEGYGCPEKGEPCPSLLPLCCLDRLEALLTPEAVQSAVEELTPEAPSILGQAARQLLALLLNASLATNTPLGLVGGLTMEQSIGLTDFPDAAEMLGSSSTIGALVAAADAALMAFDAGAAQVLEPVLAAANTEGRPSILRCCQ